MIWILMTMKTNIFLFHPSDDMKHDYRFIFTVVDTIVDLFNATTDIFGYKYHICSCQYKCKNVFASWRNLATKFNKKIIV